MHDFYEKLEITMCNDCRHLKMKCNICCQCESKLERDPISQKKIIQVVLLFETEKNEMEVV